MTITDEAGNTNSYTKYYEVTEETGITGFLNYPNPFAPSVEQTRIAYVLGQNETELKLEIYDASSGSTMALFPSATVWSATKKSLD